MRHPGSKTGRVVRVDSPARQRRLAAQGWQVLDGDQATPDSDPAPAFGAPATPNTTDGGDADQED